MIIDRKEATMTTSAQATDRMLLTIHLKHQKDKINIASKAQ